MLTAKEKTDLAKQIVLNLAKGGTNFIDNTPSVLSSGILSVTRNLIDGLEEMQTKFLEQDQVINDFLEKHEEKKRLYVNMRRVCL